MDPNESSDQSTRVPEGALSNNSKILPQPGPKGRSHAKPGMDSARLLMESDIFLRRSELFDKAPCGIFPSEITLNRIRPKDDPMIKSTMMVLALAAVAAGMITGASAEVPSPLKQFQSGIPMGEISCRDGRILMETPRASPACVMADSVQRLAGTGWTVISKGASEDTETGFSGTGPPQTITIQSKAAPVNSTDRVAELFGSGRGPPPCILPSSISVDVPDRAALGIPFNVSITPSFELTEQQLEDYNVQHRTSFGDAQEMWDEICTTGRGYGISSPATYVPTGSNVSFATKHLTIDYYPPFYRHVHFFHNMSFGSNSTVTFQMMINEPVIFRMSDVHDRSNEDYYKYDYGYFIVRAGPPSAYGIPPPYFLTHPSVSGNTVYLSEQPFADARSVIPLKERGPDDQYVPIRDENNRGYVAIIRPPSDERVPAQSRTVDQMTDSDFDMFYGWIAEDLTDGPFEGEDPAEFVKRFEGMNDTHVEEFLDRYPQFRADAQSFGPVLSWILPHALGQSSAPNLAYVSGRITALGPDDAAVPVYGINTCAFDVADGNDSSMPHLYRKHPVL